MSVANGLVFPKVQLFMFNHDARCHVGVFAVLFNIL